MIRILGTAIAGLLGLAFGSFLNVCLSRWPEGESVVKPRSHCRNCGRTLAWWENVPLVSWIAAARALPDMPRQRSVGGIRLWSWQSECCGRFLPGKFMPEFLSFLGCQLLSSAGISWPLSGCLSFCWLLVGLQYSMRRTFGFRIGSRCRESPLDSCLQLRKQSLDALSPLHDTVNRSEVIRSRSDRLRLARLKAFSPPRPHPPHPLDLLAHSTTRRHWARRCEADGDAGRMAGALGCVAFICHRHPAGGRVRAGNARVPASRRESDTWHLSKLPLGTFLCIGGIISALWGQPIIAAYLRWVGL